MTKKDYTAIAGALLEARRITQANDGTGDNAARVGILRVERELIRVLQADNPRFDAERFCVASGLHTF